MSLLSAGFGVEIHSNQLAQKLRLVT